MMLRRKEECKRRRRRRRRGALPVRGQLIPTNLHQSRRSAGTDFSSIWMDGCTREQLTSLFTLMTSASVVRSAAFGKPLCCQKDRLHLLCHFPTGYCHQKVFCDTHHVDGTSDGKM
ncbi:uncharacterized protein ACBT44_018182 isoform 1-T1 [Syngnathus typhle]